MASWFELVMMNGVFIILEKLREWRSPWEDDRRESQLALLHSNLRHEGPEARGVWQALCDYVQRGVWHALVKDDDWIWPGRWELLLLCVRFMMLHAAFSTSFSRQSMSCWVSVLAPEHVQCVALAPRLLCRGLELTYNYGIESYDVGTGLTHVAVAVENPKVSHHSPHWDPQCPQLRIQLVWIRPIW